MTTEQDPKAPAARDLLYAIGDVHGRADLLAQLLAFVGSDAERLGRAPAVIFLGDIADRGPDTCQALDLVGETLARWPLSRLCLGNHDEFLLRFLEGEREFESAMEHWLSQGGTEALCSYGLTTGTPAEFRRRILDAHPHHLDLLRRASLIEFEAGFAFVHAGIDPRRPLAEQGRQDFLWVRDPFLCHVGRLDHVFVHGHTPQKPARPHVTENRISMDTGAVFSDVLAVLRIDRREGSLSFFASDGRGSVERIQPVLLDRGLGTALDDYG